jgi:hypothetical protein
MVSRAGIILGIISAIGIGGLFWYATVKAAKVTPAPTPRILLTIDKKYVKHGDLVNWNASGLIVGETYGVGILANNKIYWDPLVNKFQASSETMRGQYLVSKEVPWGIHEFVIFDGKQNILARAQIIVILPIVPPEQPLPPVILPIIPPGSEFLFPL